MALLAAAASLGASPARAVLMEPDRRVESSGLHSATGHVSCGSGSGTAQLVGSGGTIVTAAHVLFGRNGLRADSRNCRFEIIVDGARLTAPIDVTRVRAGTSDPYKAHASHDWAVARLAAPLRGVAPYNLGAMPSPGQSVTLVSGRTLGQTGSVMRESCQVRALRRAEGGNEVMIDCSAQAGDSGAALFDRAGRVTAVYVGFRSTAPQLRQSFSTEHYNFAVAVSASMRAALAELSQ
ncbi:MAG: trypsin-like peptidase domain-containing protein [Bosea sp.]|jgi:hypothetical protein|nr:trypsin-like peptidase domain-containing protein [Bosea sp. (in: a-proteobacteria)]